MTFHNLPLIFLQGIYYIHSDIPIFKLINTVSNFLTQICVVSSNRQQIFLNCHAEEEDSVTDVDGVTA
jgi:hypothetical protein